ncbi:hypothetical protein LCGC14_1505960 [marine sediment metagenome]|uniref:Uncharacterized protein n=1 Tax=marine sediment metagenome TaxID=412755 RepID=A0A0F8WND0_9ZZZZ
MEEIKSIRWVLDKEDSDTFIELWKKLGLRNKSEVLRFAVTFANENYSNDKAR